MTRSNTNLSQKRKPYGKSVFDFWQILSFPQRLSIIGIFAMVLISPLLLFASSQQTRVTPRAAAPIPKPTPTERPVTFYLAVKFPNESTNRSYLVTPPIPPSNALAIGNPFTIEAWVKVPKPASGNYLRDYTLLVLTKIQTMADWGHLYRFSLETQEKDGVTRPMFSALKANSYDPNIGQNYISVGGSNYKSFLPDTWNHLAVVSYSDGNYCNLRLYINGILSDKQQQYTENCQISTQSPEQFFVAKPPPGLGGISGYYYPGVIDELRISEMVRYKSDFSPPSEPFIPDSYTLALWHFDNNTEDSSGNRNHSQVAGQIEYVKSVEEFSLSPTPIPTSTPPLTPPVAVTNTPTPTPSSYPTRPPTPPQSNNPVITTAFLPSARINVNYKAIVQGYDIDVKDDLTMTIYLPQDLGLSQGSCTQSINNRRKTKDIQCIIAGKPKTIGSYNVPVLLTDNQGGAAKKILKLTVK